LALVVIAVALPGCTTHSEPVYVNRVDETELSEKHKQQIAAFLKQYFGSPSQPRSAAPVESATPETDQQPSESAAASGSTVAVRDSVDPLHLQWGGELYRKHCGLCHGVTGDGKGEAAAYLSPLPRDYRRGRFKFTSTVREARPRRSDLIRVVRQGAKGTSMPAFRWMPDDEMAAVIDYVIHLSQRGELEYALIDEAENVLGETEDFDPASVASHVRNIADTWAAADQQVLHPATLQPPRTDETVRRGAEAFVELNCYKCHGKDGRGNRAFDVGKDIWGHTAFAADLSSGMLHGGRRSVDLYRRIYGGITGTPMPGSNVLDASKNETLEQRSETIWHLTHFIRSVVEGKEIPADVIDQAIQRHEGGAPSATAAPPLAPAETDPKETGASETGASGPTSSGADSADPASP
jgi:mono/diheme cytochrome c family protein